MSPAVIVNGSGSYEGFPCTDAPSGMVSDAPAASAPRAVHPVRHRGGLVVVRGGLGAPSGVARARRAPGRW